MPVIGGAMSQVPPDSPHPSQPPEDEDPAFDVAVGEEGAGAFETGVAVAMVIAAILGATIAWRASVLSDDAQGMFDLAAQQRAQREQELATIDLQVDHDVRLTRQYGDHLHAQTIFSARSARATDPRLADLLDRRARAEQLLARTLSSHFLAQFPTVDEKGRATYDRERAKRALLAGSPVADILPDETFAAGQAVRSIVVRLIGIAFLSVAALFFLTLAQLFAGRGFRILFGASGLAVLVLAGTLFVAVGGG